MLTGIRSLGLTGLIQDLRGLKDDEINDKIKESHYEVGELIVNRAGPRMQSTRAAATLRARRQSRYAVLAYGSDSVPWAQGQEWGSHRYPQFPPVKQSGYNIYPVIAQSEGDIYQIYERGIDRMLGTIFND